MLHLYLDDKEAVLPSNVSITLSFQNDFLNDKSEDASYPFSMSVSANRHIFGFPDRIENGYYAESFSACLFAGPYLLLDGNAYIETIEGDNADIYIATSGKSFWKQAEERNIGSDLHHESNMWSSEISDSLRNYYRYVFAPLMDTVNNHLINAPEKLGSAIYYKELRPFFRVKELLKFNVNKIGYNLNYNTLDKIDWFKNLLIISLYSYELNTAYYPLPEITFRELIEELELRFAVRFLVNDITKTVDIVRFDETLENGRILYGFDNPQISFLPKEDYAKKYTFSDKKTDDPTVDNADSIYPYPYFDNNAGEKLECISTQIGKQGNHAAVGEAIGGDDKKGFRLGIYKGMADNYPVMDAAELSWQSLCQYQNKRIVYLKRRKNYVFHVYPDSIHILQYVRSLFREPIIINHSRFLGISAEITLNAAAISEFSLECTPL